MREYYYDATALGTNENNSTMILYKDDDDHWYHRYSVPDEKWVEDSDYTMESYIGEQYPEKTTKEQALKRIEELKEMYKKGLLRFTL